jgi:hypothetical protein
LLNDEGKTLFQAALARGYHGVAKVTVRCADGVQAFTKPAPQLFKFTFLCLTFKQYDVLDSVTVAYPQPQSKSENCFGSWIY